MQPSNSCSDSDQISPAPYKACVTGNYMEPAQEEEKAQLNYSLIITTFFEGFVFIEGDKMILLVFFWTSISDSTSADHPDYPRYPWWRRPGWAQGTGKLFTFTQGADFKPTKPWWPRYPEGGFLN